MSSDISLFLMSFKGFSTLEKLCRDGYDKHISLVVSAFDKNVENDYIQEIKQTCDYYNIPFYLRKDDFKIETDYCIAISWRWMINLTKSRLIVLHDSILPKYRGFAPLVNQLSHKEKKIGVTALFAEEESYDTGPIISQSISGVKYPLKIEEAIRIVSNCYYDLVKEIFNTLINGKTLPEIKQDNSRATYSLWRDESDYEINWSDSAVDIKNFVDAVGYPYKGASSLMDEKVIRILNVELTDDVVIENRDVGKIIFLKNGFPVIVCGKGLLSITDAVFDDSVDSIFPLKKFRIRFK